MSLNKLTGHGSISNLIQINWEICEKMSAEFSAFPYKYDLEWRSQSLKLKSNDTVYRSQSSCKFRRKVSLYMSEWEPVLEVFWQNHISWVLSTEHWSDEIKWVCGSSNQQVSTAYQIPTSCAINDAEIFAFSNHSDLESRSRSSRIVQSWRVQWYLSSHQVWTKLVHKCLNACQS